ncbi:MAG: glycerol kinase GlpK [Alphaproteobacteria bacterium]
MNDYIVAIDQGTTSSRAIVFDKKLKILGTGQQEFQQFFPKSGWVEHDVEEIWQSVLKVTKEAFANARIEANQVAAIGITNQRETVVVWDRATGRAVYKAVVWQDRRTSETCKRLKDEGLEAEVTKRSGLLLDPYFSATKISWILDEVAGARQKAEKGELLFGTIDCFLLWRLTNGKAHATDATNAARTCLFNIHDNCWDDELLRIFNVPRAMMPEVRDNATLFGQSEPEHLGASISIRGMAGDQQAATVGQACFQPGMMKSTYGTGCFALLNTGDKAVKSENRLLTTIAYRLGGKATYALEGSIFIAGAGVQWLRDGLGLLDDAAKSGEMAAAADPEQNLYLVPAFTGLGAPHWDADARGAIFGLTRSSGPNEFAKATLDAVCYQTKDLLEAMIADGAQGDTKLRVDGGMVRSDWLMQRLSDVLGASVERPRQIETTAIGAAYLAGLDAGLLPEPDVFANSWQPQQSFEPKSSAELIAKQYDGWKSAVRRTLSN